MAIWLFPLMIKHSLHPGYSDMPYTMYVVFVLGLLYHTLIARRDKVTSTPTLDYVVPGVHRIQLDLSTKGRECKCRAISVNIVIQRNTLTSRPSFKAMCSPPLSWPFKKIDWENRVDIIVSFIVGVLFAWQYAVST